MVNTSLVKQCIFFSCLDSSTELVHIITELRYNSVRLVGAAKEHAFLVYLETQYNKNLFRDIGYLRNGPPKTRDRVVWVSLEVAPGLRQCSLVDYLEDALRWRNPDDLIGMYFRLTEKIQQKSPKEPPSPLGHCSLKGERSSYELRNMGVNLPILKNKCLYI